jgi:glycosyltransferase involved in cell wall biosynthesis
MKFSGSLYKNLEKGMAFSVANMLRPSVPFMRLESAPALTVQMQGAAEQQVELVPSSSARTSIVKSSQRELIFNLAVGLSGYLVEVGNRASFNAPQNRYSQNFKGGEPLVLEIDASGSVLPLGCALFLMVFDAAGGRLQQFRLGIERGRATLRAQLHANARKGCFALRLAGSGKLLRIKVKIAIATPKKAAKSENRNEQPASLKRLFPQAYRTAHSVTDYLPSIVNNASHFERVAIRERSMRARELLARGVSDGAYSYEEVISFIRHTRGLTSAGAARSSLRLDEKMLKGFLSLARVVFAQRLRPEDAQEALEIYEAVARVNTKLFRQIDWIPFVFLSTEFRGSDAALAVLQRSQFNDENRIEPALLMSNVLRQRAIEGGKLLAEANHLSPLNRQLRRQGLEPVRLTGHGANPFLSLDTGTLDSVVADGPKVTVLMTTFNPDDKLNIAARSVLGQSWRNLELLIIDDCSRADLFANVKQWEQRDPRVRVIRSPRNQGTYASKNLGLQEANGEFVTCHDSDDWSHPRKLELQMEALAGNPEAVAVVAHWVRVTSDLAFQPFSGGGFLCYENLSSLMYRREPVANHVGFYDAVRTGADAEFKKRLERATGRDVLTTGKIPLSFGLLHENSLTSTSIGLGWFSPERQEYRVAAKHWLDRKKEAGNGYYLECNPKERPFATRNWLLPDREPVSEKREHYDVIVMSDFRMVGGNTLSSIEELKAQCDAGLKTAICQVGSFRKGVFARELYPAPIHDLLNAGKVDHIDLSSPVTAKVMNIRYPAIFQFAQGMTTNIDAETIQVIVNQPPAEADSRDRRYDVGECIANIHRIFGKDPKWFPIGPSVRDALTDVPPDLMGEDWFNIIDLGEWKAPRDRFVSDRPVIGRHGRDDYSKWPETAEALFGAYPNDPRYSVRVLGGAQSIAIPKFKPPTNWEVLPFNSVSPAEFLRTIDFFVYFHHAQRIEAFGRTVIEAMASGAVAILPQSFQPLFGDAAIYCKAEDVTSVVDDFYSDPAKYRAQSEKAQNFVLGNFGYRMHIDRLQKLGVPAAN